MPLIPLEDNFTDVVAKAQRGLGVSDAELAARAEISPKDLAALQAGEPLLPVLRRIARHLQLSPDALESLAKKEAYPRAPIFPRGFAMFHTRFETMGVNNYLVWDNKTREAAVIDTGSEVHELLSVVRGERLRVKHIFLTHTHRDHIAALPELVASTGAEIWLHEREPGDFTGARRFADNAYFHLGVIAIKCLPTWGHSPGQTTFYVQGLSWPLALCGDSLFSASIGGSATHFRDQIKNSRARLFSLPKDTVIGPGHGPLTTLAHERKYNPFFAPDRIAPPPPPSAPETPTPPSATPIAKPTAKPGRRPSTPGKKMPGPSKFHGRRTR
jgi:glyoxylase-like metal-dependent hydrolase (beta-lactamase superfamily II)